MANKIIPKKIIKDILIVVVGVLAIWIGLQVAFGTENPFYVVASGSMIPVLEVYDVLVVQGHDPFEEVEIGDIIVFNRPSDHNRVIVHRVVSIIDEDPKIIRTQGDANPASIPGTDFPISEEEYIGKVVYTLPQVGYVTQLLKPPTNYIIIVIVIGVMIIKQMMGKKKKEKITDLNFQDSLESENPDIKEELSDINEIEKDSEYVKSDTFEVSSNEEPVNDESVDVKTDDSKKEE